MIRTLGGRILDRDEVARVESVRAHVAEQRMRPRRGVRVASAPQTRIICCFSCMRAYRLHSHDDQSCARRNGLTGNDLYVRSHGHHRRAAAGR